MATNPHLTTIHSYNNDFRLSDELALVYEAIADARNGIVITDHRQPDEPIIYVNKAFERMTGYSKAEIIGKNCRFLQGPERDQAVIDTLRKALKDEQDILIEIRNFTKSGELFWNELAMSPIRNAKGEVTHFVGIQNDITRRKAAEQALAEEKRLLEQRVRERTAELEDINQHLLASNSELEEFAYVASHDLQEPLRKIQAFSNLLTQEFGGTLTGEAATYLDRINNASARMRTLINDLLAYSRVSTKAQPHALVSLDEIIAGVVTDLEASIAETGAKIEVAHLDDIEADALQMRQLFQNLLSNALKFRRPGVEPHIRISSAVKAERLEIRVSDNGIGIDPQYHGRIFTIFQRLHGKHEYEGTGIGLSVVRKILERHRGKVTIDSTLGQGTTFMLSFPVAPGKVLDAKT